MDWLDDIKWDGDGLVPVIAQERGSGDVLMFAWMNRQALADLRPGAPAPRPDTAALTPRQLDVLKCLMQGQPNKLIARELGLTEGTVKIHIAAILRALQARNRTEAVVMARNLGLAV